MLQYGILHIDLLSDALSNGNTVFDFNEDNYEVTSTPTDQMSYTTQEEDVVAKWLEFAQIQYGPYRDSITVKLKNSIY